MYFVTWWVVLFAVLPFGTRSQEEAGEVEAGTEPGAPVAPRLLHKMMWTTIATTVVFICIYGVFRTRIVNFDDLVTMFGKPTV
jgi:predicted secreted protein